jgi:hypothetical protein
MTFFKTLSDLKMTFLWEFFFYAHLHYIHYNIINIFLSNQNAMLMRIKNWFTIYDFNHIYKIFSFKDLIMMQSLKHVILNI